MFEHPILPRRRSREPAGGQPTPRQSPPASTRSLALLALLALATSLVLPACASYSYLAPTLTPAPAVTTADHRERERLVFLIFGDSGVGRAGQRHVGDAMREVCRERGCDFGLLLGDNIYPRGVTGTDDPKFESHFEGPYRGLGPLDIWVVPGNHDWQKPESVQAQIDYTARSERWRMPHHHFAVRSLPAWLHVYGLDTTVMHDLEGERNAEKRAALTASRDEQVVAARAALCDKPGWRLLAGHHPVYSGGYHGRREPQRGVNRAIEQALVEPLITACGVQVYFSGHEHHQEHIHAPGFEQIVQGAAGAELRPVEPIESPELTQAFGAAEHGFGLVTATPDTLVVEFFGRRSPTHFDRLYQTTCRMEGPTVRCTADSSP